MSAPIIRKTELAPGIKRFDMLAPAIAAKAQPGQFVIVKNGEYGERIPLTIAGTDPGRGTITIIFQEVGRSTMDLGLLDEGETITDLVGPLGKPTEIRRFGRVACVGGGVGTAPLLPITTALHRSGNRIDTIIGARNRELLILVEEMRAVSDTLTIVTNDGSSGEQGFVTTPLERWLSSDRKYDLVVAIGPLPMMRAVSELTRPYGISTLVSLNPIMLDGTGMCGACRVAVGNETKFACVDGPEFDGHQVDWDLAIRRAVMFRAEEEVARRQGQERGECQCR